VDGDAIPTWTTSLLGWSAPSSLVAWKHTPAAVETPDTCHRAKAPEPARCRSSLDGSHAWAVGAVADEAFLVAAAAVVVVAGGKDDVVALVGNQT